MSWRVIVWRVEFSTITLKIGFDDTVEPFGNRPGMLLCSTKKKESNMLSDSFNIKQLKSVEQLGRKENMVCFIIHSTHFRVPPSRSGVTKVLCLHMLVLLNVVLMILKHEFSVKICDCTVLNIIIKIIKKK